MLPHLQRLYAHDWAFTRELLRKAADLDLLRLEIPEAYGGLGLDNLKRRLELLYPSKHTLQLEEHDNVYTAKLTLNCME